MKRQFQSFISLPCFKDSARDVISRFLISLQHSQTKLRIRLQPSFHLLIKRTIINGGLLKETILKAKLHNIRLKRPVTSRLSRLWCKRRASPVCVFAEMLMKEPLLRAKMPKKDPIKEEWAECVRATANSIKMRRTMRKHLETFLPALRLNERCYLR